MHPRARTAPTQAPTHEPLARRRFFRRLGVCLVLLALVGLGVELSAHIVPPEELHEVAESYRRLEFLLALNPVPWTTVEGDLAVLARSLEEIDPPKADAFRGSTAALLKPFLEPAPGAGMPAPAERKGTAGELFQLAGEATAQVLTHHLEAARGSLGNHREASRHLEEARGIWAAFEPALRQDEPDSFRELGLHWLELASALGSPGILGAGAVAPKTHDFTASSGAVESFLAGRYLPAATDTPRLGPISSRKAGLPELRGELPPGANINKQLPRPRQILNMASRGVDESETPLIALGDMAFDSPFLFGEPARTLGISCNSCHNKGVTNPKFFIPGLSSQPGSVDVSNSFFAPHANNGHFDALDIPDLRGLRFTAPYGRNGRFESLREFTRNVIVNEFGGAEPEPLILDALVAYQLEFDFLPNPKLAPDGRLTAQASAEARRGEEIFRRPFEQMGDRSCASCHVPEDHFLDRRRHDIGSVAGAEEASRDRSLDTPTLLSSRFTAPYFHDGSLPTLRSVNEWFNEEFSLGLSDGDLADLTAYLETIGDGVDGYEDTMYTLDAELEEFSFFLSAYELLRARGEERLMDTTFATIAFELRAHKWDVQDRSHLPTLDRMAELMDEALAARREENYETVEEKVALYRQLYEDNADVLR